MSPVDTLLSFYKAFIFVKLYLITFFPSFMTIPLYDGLTR